MIKAAQHDKGYDLSVNMKSRYEGLMDYLMKLGMNSNVKDFDMKSSEDFYHFKDESLSEGELERDCLKDKNGSILFYDAGKLQIISNVKVKKK